MILYSSEFTQKMESKSTMPRRQVTRTGSNDSQGYEKSDGSMSDSALSTPVTEGRRRRTSISNKMANFVNLPWKSSSATQLAGV